MDEVRLIPLADIIEPKSVLRLVDRNAIEYLELRDSVREFGFTDSISVRPSNELPEKFEIIEGLHRVCVAQDLALPAIPCIIKHGVEDDDVLILQIQAQAQGVEVRPVEYARQIKAILTRKPEMTELELSFRLKKSPTWVNWLLGLLRLPPDIQKSVNRGEMPIRSGYMLSRMPRVLQRQYFEQAKTLSASQFQRLAAGVIKDFKDAVRLGAMEQFYVREFTPQSYLRHLKEILAEVTHHHAGPSLIASLGCKTALDGFYAALQWVVHLDPESIEEQRATAQARQRTQFQEDIDDPEE